MQITNDEYGESITHDVFFASCALILAVTGIIALRVRRIGETGATYTTARISETADLKAIEAAVAAGTVAISASIYKAFEQAANDNDAYVSPMYKAKEITHVPWRESAIAKTVVADTDSTTKRIETLIRSMKINYRDNAVPIDRAYRSIIDEAVRAVASGNPLEKTVLPIINNLSKGGLIYVEQPSGRFMRLDSIIQRDVRNGITNTFDEIRLKQGEQFGADGVEISSHANSAPDHAPFQGRQYSTGDTKTVNGKQYPSFDNVQAGLDRPIGGINCRHKTFPILLGISKPTYSERELLEFESRSEEQVIWNGISGSKLAGTRYDSTQYQRNMEASIRSLRFRSEDEKAAGLDTQTEAKIRSMLSQYRGFCSQVQLTPRLNRTRIA